MVELDPDEQKRREHEEHAEDERNRMKAPSDKGKQLVEKSVRIDPFEANRENIRRRRDHFLSTTLFASLEKLVPLIGNADDDQTALVKLSDEVLNLFERNLLRGKLRFERVFDRFERLRSVELLENEIFFVLETVVFQTDRIFNDPVRASEIVGALRGQIGARVDRQYAFRARN